MARNPDKNAINGFWTIANGIMNAAIAILHQGRKIPKANDKIDIEKMQEIIFMITFFI